MVVAEGVHKSFGRLEVLRGIDLEVAGQEVVCIIGPSGSGKSTLLRCVNHLEKINAGRLWVDGELVGYREYGGRLHELPRDRDIVTFCRISIRGYEASLILRAAGFENVQVLDGGIAMWPYEKVHGKLF